MTSSIRLGEIYIAPVPCVDGGKAQPAPVLVIGSPNSAGDVPGIPGDSQVDQWRESCQVVVTPQDMVDGRLADSLVFPASRQMTFSPRRFVARIGSVKAACLERMLRQVVARAVAQYSILAGAPVPFEPGITPIPPSGKVIGARERESMVEAALDGWLTTGRFNAAFERELGTFLGLPQVLTVNSGSSANLLAVSALCSPLLGERALRPGDEVLTVAAGFPTTVNPILVNGLTPVFVDVELGTYNVDVKQLAAAVGPRTRAIVLAHTLGNPFDLEAVTRLAQEHGLWLVEDCCDALGSTWQGRKVGTFGDMGTLSFYPAHHITMGEGGAVLTRDPLLARILASIRDWGRDCWCAPGRDNTCGKRFEWRLGDLPAGYDHKYVYSHLGYNLKITDLQAACGLAQLERLPEFIAARRRNFQYLRERLQSCEEFLLLPEATPGSEPSWFGFPVTLREAAGVNRVDLLRYLDQYRIGTRLLFAGNLLRQPYFQGRQYRLSGELSNTEVVMNQTFWLGVYPGLSEAMLESVAERLETFFGVNF